MICEKYAQPTGHHTTGALTIPGIGTFDATGTDGVALLYKTNRLGNVIWATQVKPTGPPATPMAYVNDMKLDATGKYVWMTGGFTGTITFPDSNLAPLVYSQTYTVFLIKFEAATGRAVGAMRFYCTNYPGSCAWIGKLFTLPMLRTAIHPHLPSPPLASIPRTASPIISNNLAPVRTGAGGMYSAQSFYGSCDYNAPGLSASPFAPTATGQYIFQVNDDCTAATWYTTLSPGGSGNWDSAIIATDPTTGDILGTVGDDAKKCDGPKRLRTSPTYIIGTDASFFALYRSLLVRGSTFHV